jgi:DNA-3-methyladenine glycosylase
MYGPPGFAYVYFTYGMHWMLNLVTEAEGFPAAVLIRAFEPLEGIARMREQRGGKRLTQLASGPAKLTRAMGIAREENGLDCCRPDSPLILARGEVVPTSSVAATPRIGLGQTPEPWLSKPWRFTIRGNEFVSR